MTLAMQNVVTAVLARPEVPKIRFTLGGIEVGPSAFRLVLDKIRSGKIDVRHEPALGAAGAKYRYTANTLFLGFQTVAGADQEALIVHECVHAAADLTHLEARIGLDEAVGYVAQCLYFYYRNEEALKKPGVRPTFADPVLREAWNVAGIARTKPSLEDKDFRGLLREIANHALYRTTHAATRSYDGVS